MRSPEVRLGWHRLLEREKKRFGGMRCTQGIVPAFNTYMCSMMRSRSFASVCIVSTSHHGHTKRKTTTVGCATVYSCNLLHYSNSLRSLQRSLPSRFTFMMWRSSQLHDNICSSSATLSLLSEQLPSILHLERLKAVGNVSGIEDSAASRLRSQHVPKVLLHM